MALKPDDNAIVRGLRTGDREAWTSLYDAYSERIWRYVARLIGSDAASVADVVQETFLSAARSASNFDPARGSLGNWLAGIAHNHVSTYWNQLDRARRLAVAAGNGRETAHDGPAELPLEQDELADVVRAVLARLPADHAVLLSAKYLDGLSVVEIQSLHGGSVDAIRSRLHRAREEFRSTFRRITRSDADDRAAVEIKQ